MGWLRTFAMDAAKTDQLSDRADHVELLLLGLFGEAGSIFSELKKEAREREAYPHRRAVLQEEIGDFLWYLVRLASSLTPALLEELDRDLSRTDLILIPDAASPGRERTCCLELGVGIGRLASTLRVGNNADSENVLSQIFALLGELAHAVSVPLADAAAANSEKRVSRWPEQRCFAPLFDENEIEEERLPRQLELHVYCRPINGQDVTFLRCNGINFGDRLTDNIVARDGYRFHDVIHCAHMVYLGWSPVLRSLLRCKRKSHPEVDEAEDGARAVILEETVAALVFSRAKQLRYYDGVSRVDYGLLKDIATLIRGHEVARVPLWQWEQAILAGFTVFRQLNHQGGGRLILDLHERDLRYIPPS